MRPQFYAARARPCAAGNARKFCLPPDDAQQLPRDFHRHPERRDDQVCRELHARDPHQSKRPEDVKALIIDGRNIYDAKELAEAGFEYSAIGC